MDRVNFWCHGHLWAWASVGLGDGVTGCAVRDGPSKEVCCEVESWEFGWPGKRGEDDERWPRGGNEQMVLKE